MSTAETPAQRRARLLVRIGDLCLELAEDLQGGAICAEDPAQKASLAAQFNHTARALRQTIAIEARLERDAVRQAREDEDHAAGRTAQAAETRKAQVRGSIERQIFSEVGPREAEAWLADLNERLDDEVLYDGFTDEDVDAHIARLSAELGLTGEARHDYLPRACRTRWTLPDTCPQSVRDFVAGSRGNPGDADDDDPDEEPDDEDEDREDEDEDEDPTPSSPVRGGGPPEGGWRGNASSETCPANPLHPAAQGPPPPTGEEGRPAVPAVAEPPPPPEPYLMPWERGERFADG